MKRILLLVLALGGCAAPEAQFAPFTANLERIDRERGRLEDAFRQTSHNCATEPDFSTAERQQCLGLSRQLYARGLDRLSQQLDVHGRALDRVGGTFRYAPPRPIIIAPPVWDSREQHTVCTTSGCSLVWFGD